MPVKRPSLPKGKPILTMVYVGGPQPDYNVEWTREFIRVYGQEVWRKCQSRSLNNKGVMAVRTCRWQRFTRLRISVESYLIQLERLGYRRLEV